MATHRNEPVKDRWSPKENEVEVKDHWSTKEKEIEVNNVSGVDEEKNDKVRNELAHKVKGEKSKKVAPEPMISFFRLFSMADKYDILLMVLGSIGAAVHGGALPIYFLFYGELINAVGDTHVENVYKYTLYLLYLGLASWLATWLEVACWMQTGERQSARLRVKYLQSLLRQDVAFFENHKTGSRNFATSIVVDPLMVQDAISEKMGTFIHYMATFFTGFGVGFNSEWRIAAMTITIIPIIAMSGGFYTWNLNGATVKATTAYAKAESCAGEAITQVRTIYSFVSESKVASAYSHALQETLRFGVKASMAKGLGMGGTYASLYSCWALLLWYGGVLVRDGKADGGAALATIMAVLIGGIGLGQVLPSFAYFTKGRVAAFNIFRVIDNKLKITNENEGTQTLESIEGLIEMRNVEFSYPSRPDVPILKNFSLAIRPGKTMAIVGSSGSGKSTVISLIERFYDPLAGDIFLDGTNLKDLNLKWLRKQIGLVNQEPILFATTIGENIRYGKDNASQEDIEEVAKAANVHTFISQLPHKYDTQVGERGVQLSGGQKQRVAIARAMLKNPTILLLDEATSALDAESEQIVHEALECVMVGRTTVVVAHRLSTIRNAHSIVVVHQGQIVENGCHEELISRGEGIYSTLIQVQNLATVREDSIMQSNPDYVYEQRLLRGATPDNTSSMIDTSLRSLSENGDKATQKDKGTGLVVEQKGSLKRLIAMTKGDWTYGVLGMIGSVLTGCTTPIYAFVLGSVMTSYYNTDKSKMKNDVAVSALILVALAICSPLIYTLQQYPLGILDERLVKRIREQMFGTILRNELGWFDREDNKSNQILALLSIDATNVRKALGDAISVFLPNIILLLVSLVGSLIVQWKMALVVGSVFPLLVLSAYITTLAQKGFAGDTMKAHARATQVAGEAMANIRTVAAFNAEDKVEALFSKELEGPMKKTLYKGQIAGFGFGCCECLMLASFALGWWYAIQLVKNGEASFAGVMRVYTVLVISAFTAAQTFALTPDFHKGSQAVASVLSVLDRKTNIDPEDPNGKEIDKVEGDIELRGVSFSYPSRPNVMIFKDLNLRVPSGHSLALVGPSGSGKSSVIALIERFYDPISGYVLIDGLDLKKYHLRSIRQHIALVQQEPALFATTIYKNILYGKDEASEAEVIEAAKSANAHEFISSLPDGYQTDVGERGVQLSGGQKQRVAIARAMLKNPTILLLDEATSALDAESEKIVQEALDRLMKGRTSVIIAHRLSTIRGADSIAFVQDGAIIEEGSHTDLLTKGGSYARLVNLQLSHEDHDYCLNS